MHTSEALTPSFESVYDFNLYFCTEKQRDKGEDAALYSVTPDAGLACSLDGCGGSGAKQYPKFQNRTGAYMASRVVFGAVRSWFLETGGQSQTEAAVAELKQKIRDYLQLCNRQGGEISRIKGSITKDLPTTAAIEVCTVREGLVDIHCLWAGDSRCYLLAPAGLMQLSEDDLHGYDAMENLMADGVLSNVISASRDFQIHSKVVTVHTPCIAFTATDGCFGYYTTPMEFEYLLLDTLLEAESPLDWEEKIISRLEGISGDDATLSGFVLGFGTFESLKQAFVPRHGQLRSRYIDGIGEKSPEEKLGLWRQYSPFYSQFLAPKAKKPPVHPPEEAAEPSGPSHGQPFLAPPDDLN